MHVLSVRPRRTCQPTCRRPVRQAIDFDEGTDYARGLYPKGGCTTKTAGRARDDPRAESDSEDDDSD